VFSSTGTGAQTISFDGNTVTESGTNDAVKTGTVNVSSGRGTITTANLDAEAAAASTSSFTSLAAVNVTSSAGASAAITVVDAALDSINASRANLGAIQNRFESTISNLQQTSENLSASRSRVLDADFAAETASLTRAQILQQAGVSILSQANQQPQSVLALLQ